MGATIFFRNRGGWAGRVSFLRSSEVQRVPRTEGDSDAKNDDPRRIPACDGHPPGRMRTAAGPASGTRSAGHRRYRPGCRHGEFHDHRRGRRYRGRERRRHREHHGDQPGNGASQVSGAGHAHAASAASSSRSARRLPRRPPADRSAPEGGCRSSPATRTSASSAAAPCSRSRSSAPPLRGAATALASSSWSLRGSLCFTS